MATKKTTRKKNDGAQAAKSDKRRARRAAQAEAKLSCLAAAAKVLAEAGQALSCQEMIAAMAAKGYWTSPGGKTPQATLAAAILREVQAKGKDARFVKTQRGRFARNQTA